MLVSEIIAEVRKIVKVRPEVTYTPENGCAYSHGKCSDGTVGCLFGQAFKNLGIDPSKFDKYPRFAYDNSSNETYIPGIDTILEEEFEGAPTERIWCALVQGGQDRGNSWFDSVYEADRDLGVSNGSSN